VENVSSLTERKLRSGLASRIANAESDAEAIKGLREEISQGRELFEVFIFIPGFASRTESLTWFSQLEIELAIKDKLNALQQVCIPLQEDKTLR
jgi:hypothetical protein